MSDYVIYLFSNEDALTGHDRLLRAAEAYTESEAEQLKIAETDEGKPYFPELPDVHFSISHSGEYWACAFGASPVGLDMQQHCDCKTERLATRFFHPDETEYLRRRDFNDRDFFEIWAAKESYIKYTGNGLAEGLETFSVIPESDKIRHIPFLQGYSMSLCSDNIGKVKICPMSGEL